MKRSLTTFFIIICLFTMACKNGNTSNEFVTKGNATGVYNGMRVYLKMYAQDGRQIVKDTAIVMNETFEFKGTIDYPTIHVINVDGINGDLVFMLENSDISIDLNKEDITKSKITGSESNLDFIGFQEGIVKLQEKGQIAMSDYRTAIVNKDSIKVDSLTKILSDHRTEFYDYGLKFGDENPDSYFSLHLLERELNKPNYDFDRINGIYRNLNTDLQNTSKGLKIMKKLDNLNIEFKKIAHLKNGEIAPAFSAPSPNGDTISLHDIRGKVTLIDFWAAWCGPCRRENPNLVKLYDQYHEKGLEIIGVSLDGATNQKNPKNAWLDAIKKDNLTWYQVSNLNYFNGPVANLYNISAIPATYLLDNEGRIIAKNLRGVALKLKVEELLGE